MVKHAAAGTAVVLALTMLTLPDGRVAHADQWCGPGFHTTGYFDNNDDGIINVGDNFYCVPDPTPPPTTAKPKPSPTTPTTTTVLATTTTAVTTKPVDPCVPRKTAVACDQDDDDLTNAQEDAKGTDPTEADTDGDGVLDGKDKDNTTPAGVDVDADGVEVIATTETVPTTTTTVAESSGGSGSSAGVIAGVSAGVVALLGGLLFGLKRRRRNPTEASE